MSRKHYIALAQAFADARRRVSTDQVALDGIEIAIDEVVRALRIDNGAFNESRFRAYILEH